MGYGTCLGGKEINFIPVAAKLGYDYFETNFGFLARGTDEEFEEFKKTVFESGIKCEAANCFMPNDLPVTGPSVDYDGIKAYVEKGMSRGSEAGLQTVVFGSGGARRIPDGFSYAEGIRQLGYFLGETVSPIAAKYGITVVIEPLRAQECNMINTVNEGVILSVLAGKNNIQTLADIYHMKFAGDTPDNIRMLKGSIKHAHISNPMPAGIAKRFYMKPSDECDYKAFVDALEYAGCPRCSIEAGTSDFASDAEEAAKVIKALRI